MIKLISPRGRETMVAEERLQEYLNIGYKRMKPKPAKQEADRTEEPDPAGPAEKGTARKPAAKKPAAKRTPAKTAKRTGK